MATGSSGKGGGVRLKKRTSAERRNRQASRMNRKKIGRMSSGGSMGSLTGEVPF